MKYIILFILYISFFNASSQNTYDIRDPAENFGTKCSECLYVLNNIPTEVNRGIDVDEHQNIFFFMSDADWFYHLIKKGGDGLAIDLVLKNQYSCASDKVEYKNYISKGHLLPPIYLKDIKKNSVLTEEGGIIIKIGTIPDEYINLDYELNLVILKNKYCCQYTVLFNIRRYKWDLLDMGLFADSIMYKTKINDSGTGSQRIVIVSKKKMKFSVPFEKSKTSYSTEDIKPLYDSLMLNDYEIKKISIRAYSSVEGSTNYNLELQNKRAISIVKALQSYQNQEIEYEITTAENWMEFYYDINQTKYSELGSLSKKEIKKRLTDEVYLAELEPYLSKHRKAIIEIEFEKKEHKEMTDSELVSAFNKSVNNNDNVKMQELLDLAFSRIINGKSPNNFLGSFEIPNQLEFGSLMNNKDVYKYFLDLEDVQTTYQSMLQLNEMLPNNRKIAYNIISLKFLLWINGDVEMDPLLFKKEIKKLRSVGISSELVNRILVNYDIVMAEQYMIIRDYRNKDKMLKDIYYKYKNSSPTSTDLLKIAQFFVAYGKYDWAIKLLKPYVTQVDSDEDLLFYYINLTIIDLDITKKSEYKRILLNAIDINKERFCNLFNSTSKGGISFQILDNEVLKMNYCESCN